jgi:hypothetical protein
MWDQADPAARAISDKTGKRESKRANAALRDYLLMGASRSISKLLAHYENDPNAPTNSRTTIALWSSEFSWVARSEQFDQIQQAKALEAYEAPWRAKIMGSTEVLGRLSDMARATVLPFIRISEDGAVFFDFSDPDAKNYFHLIKKVKTKRTRRLTGRGDDVEQWEDEWVEVELHDAQAALVNMGRHHKLFTDQQEVSGTITTKSDPENDKRFDRAISSLANTLGEILSGTGAKPDSQVGTAKQTTVAGPALPSG